MLYCFVEGMCVHNYEFRILRLGIVGGVDMDIDNDTMPCILLPGQPLAGGDRQLHPQHGMSPLSKCADVLEIQSETGTDEAM